ncbi:MAG: hypothetical protein J6W00_05200 [Lentisphaeria bacterium]|nr:hypothetical protein [Lentisphaeria bacterium]
MKKFYLIGICTALAAVISLLLIFIPESTALSTDSQNFTPSRFVVIAADINVLSPQMGNNGKIQSVVLKMDTMTGKAWILQVQVMGGNEPKVRTSSWHEVGMGRKNSN